MGSNDSNQNGYKEPLRKIIVVLVAIAHINPMYRIIICSTDMAVAFNIPVNNIGIYFSKLSGIRSLTMSLGFTLELAISKIAESVSGASDEQGKNNNKVNEIRRYMSIATLIMLTSCQVSFLLVLYLSKIPSFHNYVVLALESLIFGLFQISIVSLTPKYASTYNLSLYVSGMIILITQTISDNVTNKNSVMSVKIQAWISVILCVVSIALWSYYVIHLYQDNGDKKTESSTCGTQSNSEVQKLVSSPSPETSSSNTHSQGSSTNSNSDSVVGHTLQSQNDGKSPVKGSNGLSVDYFISMSSLSILKIMRSELKRLCTCTDNRNQVTHVKILINVLEQIRSEDGICSRLLIRIDLVIVGLKEICGLGEETRLLEQLAFVLRGKYLLSVTTCKNQITTQISQPETETREESSSGGSEQSRRRQRRTTQQEPQNSNKSLHQHLWKSLSQFTMFGAGSLVKDFLFPGVLPYALLEREKCHIINLTTIIFLAIGPVTIFIMDEAISDFKCNETYYHGFWACILPKIIIFILSLCAIHTKGGCTHKIRSSQPMVLLMTLTLLMLYGFMETVSVVGISYYVKNISKDEKNSTDLQAIQRISTVFFRYLVYKFSVGYNDTRVKSGFILPSFKPPRRVPDTFGFWLKGSLANGWKDLIQDFKLNIKTYLTHSNHGLRRLNQCNISSLTFNL